MTGTDLTRRAPSIPHGTEIDELTRLGNQLGQSGFFKDVRSGYQAFAKLLFGRDLGLSATAAMTGVHIIEGKPEISANVQAQMVRTYIGPEGERYDYLVREHTDEKCRIEFFRRWGRDSEWQPLGASEYTLAMAKRAGLASRGVWQKHPLNMLFARAMSDGVAFHCPEVTNGVRVYHDYEIDVDGEARETPSPTPVFEGSVVDGEIDRASEEIVDAIAAARSELGEATFSTDRLRAELVALGVENVPDTITRATYKRLTAEQARELFSILSAAVDEREENGGRGD